MTYHLYAIAALLLECAAIAGMDLRSASYGQIFACLMVHACACLVSSVALWFVLPQHYRQPRTRPIMFFAVFSFFTPVLGLIANLLGCIVFLRFKGEPVEYEIQSVSTPPFMVEAQHYLPLFGEGGVRARLINSSAPQPLRVKALLAVERVSGRTTNGLIRTAMQDDDDEVRLLAFGMLDNRENEINAKINALLHALEDEASAPLDRAELHRQTAQYYWELVYQELVRDNLMEYAIERALFHSDATEETLPSDPGIQLLRGRIMMHLKRYTAAGELFRKALNYGIQESRVIPYLAELAYIDRDYATVKRLLTSNPLFATIPALAPIMEFWGDET